MMRASSMFVFVVAGFAIALASSLASSDQHIEVQKQPLPAKKERENGFGEEICFADDGINSEHDELCLMQRKPRLQYPPLSALQKNQRHYGVLGSAGAFGLEKLGIAEVTIPSFETLNQNGDYVNYYQVAMRLSPVFHSPLGKAVTHMEEGKLVAEPIYLARRYSDFVDLMNALKAPMEDAKHAVGTMNVYAGPSAEFKACEKFIADVEQGFPRGRVFSGSNLKWVANKVGNSRRPDLEAWLTRTLSIDFDARFPRAHYKTKIGTDDQGNDQWGPAEDLMRPHRKKGEETWMNAFKKFFGTHMDTSRHSTFVKWEDITDELGNDLTQ